MFVAVAPMHPSLAHTAHRPWPVPAGEWTWRQRWCDLLFAHWPVPAADLRPLVPEGLGIDQFGGTSWVGIVPFRMEGVSRRPCPDFPGLSAFPELNLRLYVTRDRRPGVWFLSLDATSPVAVWAARRFFHLPYHRAAIELRRADDEFHFRAERIDGGSDVRFAAAYAPSAPVARATKGSLEAFLTERYCLYAGHPDGGLLRCDVHHEPWPLQRARAWVDAEALVAPHGIVLPATPPLLHFSRGLDVVVWAPRRAG